MAKKKIEAKLAAQEAYLASVQATYRYYCYHVNNPVKDNPTWIPSKFHMYLCNRVQEFLERETDKAYEILIISTPPQHGKSTTITETLPSWYMMRHPEHSVIEISYGDDLAERFGKKNLEKIKEYGDIFGVALDPKKSTSREFQLLGHRGRMISKGIGSGLTGHSGHLILIDDPVKNRQEADSQARREFIWNEYISSIVSRTQAHSKIILIMTRWHEDDLAGRIIEHEGDKVEVINFPCEAEENDILGRKPGDALCPEIGKDNKWLKDFKEAHLTEEGSRSWNSLYQGHPTATEGNLLKREWWQFYDPTEYLTGQLKFETMIMSVDATFKDGERNDYVAIGVWGKLENRMYLVDLLREHLNFTGTIRAIQVKKAKYPKIGAILIEDKANGSGIIQMMRKEIMGIIPVTPDRSKEARVNAVSFAIEAGNVYLPKNERFTWDFIDECAAFPNGKHDDMVDQMTQALMRLIFTRSVLKKIAEKTSGWHIPKPVQRGRGDRINVI